MKRSNSTIEKHKASLQKTLLSKLNINKWEEYLDTLLQHANNSKQKKNLTLRQYYELIKSGYSGKSLKQQGYDKHLIFFYNKLLKNEISITKEQFQKDYLDGMSLDKISKKYSIERSCTTFLRELFGIKRKGATYIKRKENDIVLTQKQKELLYGTLMGDGKKTSNSSFGIKHSTKVSSYVLWKYSILHNIVSSKSLKEEIAYDKRYDTVNRGLRFYTHANSDVEFILNQFYCNGKKKITSEILDQITNFGLAVWYMDDGKIDWSHSQRQKYKNSRPSISLCTDDFTLEECELIKQFFQDKWNIEAYIKEHRPYQYRIKFNVNATEKFLTIVSPHIVPCMQYKINYTWYLRYRDAKASQIRYRVKDCPLGQDFDSLKETEKDTWVESVFTKLRKNKFPYPDISEKSIFNFFRKLKNHDSSKEIKHQFIKHYSYPVSVLSHFHPHLYKMSRKGTFSPFAVFQTDALLREAILSIIKRNEFPSKDAVRRQIGRYKTISNFSAFSAKAIFETICDRPNSVAIDFCAGFGGRMLGAIANSKISHYWACEPNIKTYMGLLNIVRKYRELDVTLNNTEVTLANVTADMFLERLGDNLADAICTSPPYFDTEIYGDFGQSIQSFPRYGEWLDEWLFKCIKNSIRILRPDGILALNIANSGPYNIADDTEKFLLTQKGQITKWDMYLSPTKTEPLLIFTNRKENL